MGAAAEVVAEPVVGQRTHPRFSGRGNYATCLMTDERGDVFLEHWTLTHGGPWRLGKTEYVTDAGSAIALPVEDGRVLVGEGWHEGAAFHQTFSVIDRGELRLLGRAPVPMRPVPAPDVPGVLAMGVAMHAGGPSTVYRITDEPPWFEPVAKVGGAVVGGVATATHSVFTLAGAYPLVVDPITGRTRRLPPPSGCVRSAVAAAGDGTILLAAGAAAGERRFGLVRVDDPRAVTWLDTGGLGGRVTPLAVSPQGERVAMLVERGARSGVVLAGPSARRTEVGSPAASLAPAAGWSGHGLWLPGSAPARPPAFAWLPRVRLRHRLVWPEDEEGWHDGSTEWLPGATGPIEALTLGPDWRTARRVVLALHDGPGEHWRLGFDRTFQAMAGAGIAVLALNPRGSTGYGRRHELAVAGAWGVPDLADVLAVAAHVRTERGNRSSPALLGVGYGAFLALLAATVEPAGWFRCVAAAPFLSPSRWHADGGEEARELIERFDGLTEPDDHLNPRELLRFAPALRTPLLLLHGDADNVVSVAHSRRLATRLTALGARFQYRELAGRGHDLLSRLPTDPEVAAAVSFLQARRG